jgi:hypothetical protein
MKYNPLIILVFLLVALIPVISIGQQAVNDFGFFTLNKQEFTSQAVNEWYFFDNREVALSERGKITWDGSIQTQRKLADDHLMMVYSADGNFFALADLNPRASLEPIDRQLNIQVYSSGQDKLYTIHRKHFYDHMFPTIAIASQTAAAVLGESDTGEMWFYDSKGIMKQNIVLFPEAEYDLERILQFQWNNDGSEVAVLATKRASAPMGSGAKNPNSEPHLFLFDSNGRKLWEKTLLNLSASGLLYSPDGKHILVNNFTVHADGKISKKAFIYNPGGTPVFETDILYKYAHFSPEGKRVIMAENQQVRVFDIERKTELWQQKIARNDGMVTAVKTSIDAEVSLVLIAKNDWNGERFVFNQPQVKIVDRKGNVLQEIKMPDKSFRHPALWLSEDGTQFKLGFDDGFVTYKLK